MTWLSLQHLTSGRRRSRDFASALRRFLFISSKLSSSARNHGQEHGLFRSEEKTENGICFLIICRRLPVYVHRESYVLKLSNILSPSRYRARLLSYLSANNLFRCNCRPCRDILFILVFSICIFHWNWNVILISINISVLFNKVHSS